MNVDERRVTLTLRSSSDKLDYECSLAVLSPILKNENLLTSVGNAYVRKKIILFLALKPTTSSMPRARVLYLLFDSFSCVVVQSVGKL